MRSAVGSSPSHGSPTTAATLTDCLWSGFLTIRHGGRTSSSGWANSCGKAREKLCWAAADPGRVQVELVDPGEKVLERHSSYLARLGLRSGDNRTSIATRLVSAPNYGEQTSICALSGRSTCH